MHIAVIGTGYVGLVTGVGFAEMGYDIDEAKIAQLQRGEPPIYEPELDIYLEKNLKAGRLHFTTSLQEAVSRADVIFLALPTPPREDGHADLSALFQVTDQMAPHLRPEAIVVVKSTVPVGTTEKIGELIREKARVPFYMVFNPEFLREGKAMEDFLRPDRIVVGTDHPKAAEVMKFIYEPFVRQGNPILMMDIRSAELTKYAANAFLAMRVSFINEISWICEAAEADVNHVRMAIGLDHRIGRHFLYPGIGYGGSCFPKDLKALIATARELGEQLYIVPAVEKVNMLQRERFLRKIADYFLRRQLPLKDATFAIWGLAFKPETDDIREAPALTTIDWLLDHGARLRLWDQAALANVRRKYGDHPQIVYASDMYDALRDADALVIHTEWGEFRRPDFGQMKQLMKQPVIFDGRNLYDLGLMEREGFDYISIGRRPVYAYQPQLAKSAQ